MMPLSMCYINISVCDLYDLYRQSIIDVMWCIKCKLQHYKFTFKYVNPPWYMYMVIEMPSPCMNIQCTCEYMRSTFPLKKKSLSFNRYVHVYSTFQFPQSRFHTLHCKLFANACG